MDTLHNLINKLGHNFSDERLLRLALRHRSVGKDSNERLEFLGDSILSSIITEALFHKYPNHHEGELSRLRANLVRRETLADLARVFSLKEYLFLGNSEKKSGDSHRDSILADALEAIVGAIYLDAGLTTCQKVVLNWYGNRLEDSNVAQKDSKSLLQEYLQANKKPLPIYEIAKTEGKAHNQTFHIYCKVPGFGLSTEGKGRNKQEAEQDAAQRFLKQLNNK